MVVVLLIIIIILILQLINSTEEISYECREVHKPSELHKINQRRVHREINNHIAERDEKREAIEKKFTEQQHSKNLEIKNMAISEADVIKNELRLKLNAAIKSGNTELAGSISRDLRVLDNFVI